MEEAVAAGRTLNQEQKEVMRSKPTLAAVIDELERLRAPLAVAVAEEVSVSVPPAPAPSASGSDSFVQDLLALVYFGALFDVKPQSDFIATMAAREHEWSSCITYDCVEDDTVDLLVEGDLDVVSAVAALAAARPASAVGVSHRDALQACAHHARLWLVRADEPIHPGSSVTYAAVRAKLDRIMASDYYTAAAVGGYGAEGVQI
ncbi:protein MLP1 [Hordeum vulgare]|nr:protein MLP1 [Hordeum vulgare]